jgi:ketosteroid isomerase-like protein
VNENERLVRGIYDAQARGDIGAYLDSLSEDFVLHIPGRSQIAGDYRGKEEMRRHFADIAQLSGGTFRTAVHDVVAGEDHAVGLIDASASRADDVIDLPRIHVWHVRSGELSELWLHPSDQYSFDRYWG